MAQEIERVWWLQEMPPLIKVPHQSLEILQAYMPVEHGEHRVRKTFNRSDSTTSFVETHKSGSGLVRTEVETVINSEAYEALLSETFCQVTKNRTVFEIGNHKYELDEYQLHSQLVLLQVEFESVEQAKTFQLPSWLEKIAVEVTNRKEFSAGWIAKFGCPKLPK